MNIGYELARELREAGFPQAGKGTQTGPSDKLVWRAGDRVYVPTLSEMIEACGTTNEGFGALTKEHSQSGDSWVASSFYSHRYGRGSSPEEAVARLWLALRKCA
jgi:hypothetical protein